MDSIENRLGTKDGRSGKKSRFAGNVQEINIYDEGGDSSEGDVEADFSVNLQKTRAKNKENIIKYASKSQLVRFITDPSIVSKLNSDGNNRIPLTN